MSVPVRVSVVVGLKVTLIVRYPFAGTLGPLVLVGAKLPLVVRLEMGSAVLRLLVKVVPVTQERTRS